MNVVDYVRGTYAAASVGDLVLTRAGDVQLLFILESPHRDELSARHPLDGAAGRDALAYLEERPRNAHSLGSLVQRRIDSGDPRVAILNTSTVPLQASAFRPADPIKAPALSDWSPLVELRQTYTRSKTAPLGASAQAVADAILDDLRIRLAPIPMNPQSHVVVCGGIARRFARQTSVFKTQPVLDVRHPAWGWWNKGVGPLSDNLLAVRDHFRTLS